MAQTYDEKNPRYNESSATTTVSKGIHSKYLGTVTVALRTFLEKLASEHRHTLWIETVDAKSAYGAAEIKATVYSKDPKKVEWIEWMLRQAHRDTVPQPSSPHIPKLNEMLKRTAPTPPLQLPPGPLF